MQLTVRQADLAEAMGVACGVVNKRHTIPIMANVLLRADGDRLLIKATNLDQELDLGCAVVAVQAPGSVTAPAETLHRLARKFPADAEIGLTFLARENQLRVSCGRSRYDLPVLHPDDFPTFADNIVGGMPIEPRLLKGLLSRVRFAVSTDETRHYLQGVFLHRADEQLVAVASNGHVLARDAIPLPPQAGDLPATILPREFVSEAVRLLPDEAGDDAYLAITPSKAALFLPDGTRLLSKLIEGTYPDYSRVIPAANPHLAELPRAPLIAAIERASVMLERKSSNCLRMTWRKGRLDIASYTDAKGYASERLDIVYDGPKAELGVNAGYLLDVIARYGGETIALRFGDASAPLLWRDAGYGDDPALAVVMPMRINAMPADLKEEAA